MSDRLKPWQRVRVRCYADGCDDRAVREVSTNTLLVEEDASGAIHGHGCEVHAQQLADELCDLHGAAVMDPIRNTWRMWLWSLRFMRALAGYLRPHEWEWPENGEVLRQAPCRWSWRVDHSVPDELGDGWYVTTPDHMDMGTAWTRRGARRAQARALDQVASR